MKAAYYAGRFLQLIGLLAMPSAIWITHFERNESAALTVFIGSGAVFFVGYFLSRAFRSGP